MIKHSVAIGWTSTTFVPAVIFVNVANWVSEQSSATLCMMFQVFYNNGLPEKDWCFSAVCLVFHRETSCSWQKKHQSSSPAAPESMLSWQDSPLMDKSNPANSPIGMVFQQRFKCGNHINQVLGCWFLLSTERINMHQHKHQNLRSQRSLNSKKNRFTFPTTIDEHTKR